MNQRSSDPPELPDLNVVTGAFSYSGKHIAQRLLSQGKAVATLTNHPDHPDPFQNRVRVYPYNFTSPSQLAGSLQGATTLYNTYWIRFPRGPRTFDLAVENTKTMLQAALEAGVNRLVHISITNPSTDSPLPYFRGKALVEQAIKDSGIPYAILRPTLVFGGEDVLLNNIAWFLRRFPLFPIAGSGQYPLQPVHVEDLADLAVAAGAEHGNSVIDAVGPVTINFVDLVRLIAQKVNSRARLVAVPPRAALTMARLMSLAMRDVVLTKDEIKGLMDGLLVSTGPATCPTSISDWLEENHQHLGATYASELRRHYR